MGLACGFALRCFAQELRHQELLSSLLLAWLQHPNHQAFPKIVCFKGPALPAEIIFFELTSLLLKTEKQ